jgi:hypothetical protein
MPTHPKFPTWPNPIQSGRITPTYDMASTGCLCETVNRIADLHPELIHRIDGVIDTSRWAGIGPDSSKLRAAMGRLSVNTLPFPTSLASLI